MGSKQFMIVGSQRSGTTLLELILDSHPDIKILGEPEVYNSFNKSSDNGKHLGYKVPMWTHRYHFFRDTYPNSKILFLFRDIKSIASSMLSLVFKQYNNRDWVDINARGEMMNSITGISKPYIRNFFRKEIGTQDNKVLIATLCAYIKSYLYEEYKNAKMDVFPVKYHKLVQEPREEIERVLFFLKIPWSDEVLRHHELHKGVFIGNTNSQRKIDVSSLEKWRKRFSEEEIKRIDEYLTYLEKNIKEYL